MAAAAAVLLVVLSGVLAAAAMPRGPVTRVGAVALLAGVLLVGAAAGALLGSRWAVPLAPAAHLAGFELARATVVHVDGATYGPVELDLAAGILLFVVGHVLYALAVTPPAMLGAIGGAALTRRLTPRPARPARTGLRQAASHAALGLRVLLTVLLALGVGLLGFGLARPGRVAPVLGGDGRPLAGSIAVQQRVRLGGVDQWVSIRGRSADNPVLLYLSGGPGGSDLALVRANRRLEDHFTVAVWEQRGSGMSYRSIDPTSALTLNRLVDDGVELTRWLRARFGERKVYLVGSSWGSTLGVLMVQRHPELYWAYVGSGQMVSQRATDKTLYEQSLAYADWIGDEAMARSLRSLGPPPWNDATTAALGNATMGLLYDDLEPYGLNATELRPSAVLERFFNREYGLLDSWNALRGLPDTFGVLYPQLRDVDFRRTVTRLDVPVYLLEGRHELSARRLPVLDWYRRLQAPSKQLRWFQHSGHDPQFEEATRYTHVLVDVVLAQTYPRPPAAQ